jgi:hypothetical protein
MSRQSQKKGGRVSGGSPFDGSKKGLGTFGAFSASAAPGSNLSYLVEPPDFSSISDANVVVSFKNLLKRDSTTKSKALEDLIFSVQAVPPFEENGGVEDPVLESWVGLSCVWEVSVKHLVTGNRFNSTLASPWITLAEYVNCLTPYS